MKQKFSTSWKSSKQPRKQRKYIANAPKHLRRNFMSVNLTKELRKKFGKRNIQLRKGDTVKIMRGTFKKKMGKITEVNLKKIRVYVENVQLKKKDGSKINYPLHPSVLQIIELNLEDKKRFGEKKAKEEKTQKKTEVKEETKKDKKKIKTNEIKNAS